MANSVAYLQEIPEESRISICLLCLSRSHNASMDIVVVEGQHMANQSWLFCNRVAMGRSLCPAMHYDIESEAVLSRLLSY